MGMLSGFIGGVANTGAKMLADDREREGRMADRKVELEYASELEAKRQASVAALKAKMEEEAAKKDATMRVESDEAGRESLSRRAFEQFKRDLGQTDASEEQLREVFAQQYFDRDVAPGDANSQRYDPKDSEFTRQSRTEAMNRGASSGLINAYTGQMKEDVANERYVEQQTRQARIDAEKRARDEARDEREADKTDAQIKLLAAQAGRAERTGSGGSASQADKLTETQRARLDILKRNVLEAEKALGESGSIKSRRDAAQTRVDEAYRKLEEFTSQVDGKPSTPKAPATENKPSATPPMTALKEGRITTFANGQKWKLVDGKPVQVK